MKVFDLGKNHPLHKLLEDIDHNASSTYAEGAADQFLRDLMLTGRAAYPDGDIVELFPQPKDKP